MKSDEQLRAEILHRWNMRQQRRNLFTCITEEQLKRAVKREKKNLESISNTDRTED